MHRHRNPHLLFLFVPSLAVFAAFFLIPLTRLALTSASGPSGFNLYLLSLTHPRYLLTLVNTIVLSIVVTLVTLIISGFTGVFLTRNQFPGKSLIVSLLTFPLAFPGVVVGFMIILLVGRQGLIGDVSRFCLIQLRDSFWVISIFPFPG
jgi:putative spermidine/putrescine transport system permease protein